MVINMSISEIENFQNITDLIDQFKDYKEIFKLIFLRYNGKNEEIALHYRLRTYKNFMNKIEFLNTLLSQYFKNPIQIPSDLFYVEIYDQLN